MRIDLWFVGLCFWLAQPDRRCKRLVITRSKARLARRIVSAAGKC
jgi:hypothetical protein